MLAIKRLSFIQLWRKREVAIIYEKDRTLCCLCRGKKAKRGAAVKGKGYRFDIVNFRSIADGFCFELGGNANTVYFKL